MSRQDVIDIKDAQLEEAYAAMKKADKAIDVLEDKLRIKTNELINAQGSIGDLHAELAATEKELTDVEEWLDDANHKINDLTMELSDA